MNTLTDLPNTEIDGFKVVLLPVPASAARRIQTMLLAIIAEPLAEALGQQSEGMDFKNIKNIKDASNLGQQILAGIKGLAGILPKLNDGQLDEIINKCKPFIKINGEKFDEDRHFSAKTLMSEYEIIWFFLKETFGDFIDAVVLRFSKTVTAAA